MNQPSQRQLFIVGFARSGTSLLYSFLNLHPKIKLLYEADLLSQSMVAVAIRTGQKWWERLDFLNAACRRHHLVPQPSWKNIRSTKETALTLYREYGGDKEYIGEKSPTYYNCLPAMARRFPDAKFVVIWRNPTNVISSIIAAGKKHYFFSSPTFPLRALVGFEQMQSDVLALRAKGAAVFDLCYESLVEDPENWLKQICEFLEIPFDPGMLQLDHADCSMFPAGEHHIKAKSGHLERSDRQDTMRVDPMQNKVPHYFARWRGLFGDKLQTVRYWPRADGGKPGFLEVLADRFEYRVACLISEQFTPLIYGFFPLSALRRYRVWRGKTFAPSSSANVEVQGDHGASSSLKISVVTPSYKQLPWLKLCVASVADQQGVNVEHIIQDAQSGPELEEWVTKKSNARLFVECDTGMYDAINRGFARATGDIVCWLNSDEQYLPGSLAKVARFFETHPDIDALFGDALLIGNSGNLLSYRRTVFPNLRHIQASHLNVLSCATFVRRSVLDRGFDLDTRWKAIADAVWVADMLKARIPMAVMNEPLSVFTITDQNLGQTSLAFNESEVWQQETSSTSLWLRPYFVIRHRLTKLFRGAYWPRAVSTSVYTLASPESRLLLHARHLGFRWPRSGER